MQFLAAKKAECQQAALECRIAALEDELVEERLARANMENMSQNGSNSRHHVARYYNPRVQRAAKILHLVLLSRYPTLNLQ